MGSFVSPISHPIWSLDLRNEINIDSNFLLARPFTAKQVDYIMFPKCRNQNVSQCKRWLHCFSGHGGRNILSKKIEWIFTLFVTDVTPWGVTSVITAFGVNIEWTGRDSARWVVNCHSTGVRIEWNSLLNEWNFFIPWMEWIIHSILESRDSSLLHSHISLFDSL